MALFQFVSGRGYRATKTEDVDNQDSLCGRGELRPECSQLKHRIRVLLINYYYYYVIAVVAREHLSQINYS